MCLPLISNPWQVLKRVTSDFTTCSPLTQLCGYRSLRYVTVPVRFVVMYLEEPHFLWPNRSFADKVLIPSIGLRTCTSKLYSQICLPCISMDAQQRARAYMPCQPSKLQWHNSTSAGEFPTPHARFQHIHLCMLCPLSMSQSCSCRFTRFPVVLPIQYITTAAVVQSQVNHWISSFDVPATKLSDRHTIEIHPV